MAGIVKTIGDFDYHYGDIKQVIEEVSTIHAEFSATWSESKAGAITIPNLNKKQIRNICLFEQGSSSFNIEPQFFDLLERYLFQVERYTSLEFDPQEEYSQFDCRSRTKQKESVIGKIEHYRLGKSEEGKIAIRKSLNDLYGFRLHIPGFIHGEEKFHEMCSALQSDFSIKWMNSSKNGYKGTHIYFMGGNNKSFPWELQIWNPEDEKSNYDSHEIHKQGYTRWAKNYKESVERGE